MKDFFKNKIFIIIAVLTLFIIGFMLFTFSGRDKVTPAEDFIGIVITPIQKAFMRISEKGGNIVKCLTEYEDLLKENEKLKDELAKSVNIIKESQKSIVENEELKKMLDIKEKHSDFEFVSGFIISRDTSQSSGVFTIDKGMIDGIRRKDAVMTSQGIVGYISDVGSTWAKVTTLKDPGAVMGAVVSRTREIGVCEGTLDLQNKNQFKLSYMEKDSSFAKGDIIETSGIGNNFPSGIAIGRVVDVKPESHGISKYGIVEPFVDFENLKNVYVITNFTGSEKDDTTSDSK